ATRAGDAVLAGKIDVLKAEIGARGETIAPPEKGAEPLTAALTSRAIGRAALAEASRLLEETDESYAAIRQQAQAARQRFDQALAEMPKHLHANFAALYLDRAHASLLLEEQAAAQNDAMRAIRHADLVDPEGKLATSARATMAIALRAGRRSDAAAL